MGLEEVFGGMLPGLRDWIFSVKTFVSAMVALAIALRLGLDRPYWAMATAYMVSQPLTGAMRSKGAYRFIGTLLGAIVAVALVPNLVDAPILLVIATSLWTGICLFFALLDRTPRSYVFMLAGYTAAIIGFPAVTAPLGVFETALVRVEEISLGIICSTVIGTIVLPRPVGPVIIAQLDSWFGVARDWIFAVLAGRRDEEAARRARRAMAGASVEVGMLTTHLAYDTSLLQTATRPVSVLQRRMMFLLPVISGIGDRLDLLRAADALSPEIQTVLDRLAGWIRSGDDASDRETARMQDAIASATPRLTAAADWKTILQASLMSRLAELVELAHDVQALRRQVMTGSSSLPKLALPRGLAPDATRYRDYGMALLSAFAAALTVGLVCCFWIATAWPDGATAAMMAAVLCSFFAAQDDPVPAILSFLYCTAIAIVIDTVYLFAILPVVTSFEMLVLALAPTFLVLGVLIARPATFLAGLAIAVNGASMLALTDTYNANFADFVNTSLAALAGMAAAATVTAIIRSVGAAWSARRLQRAGWRDIARAASRHAAIERPALAARMLDRLADLTGRLAASDLHADRAIRDALLDLRIGLNVVDLERESPELEPPTRASLQAMLDGIEEYYRSQAPAPPDAGLRARIDSAIAGVVAAPGRQLGSMLMLLLGIRQSLFPAAPPYAAPARAQVLEAAQ
jgi:uncharacterized membrane protein YccC